MEDVVTTAVQSTKQYDQFRILANNRVVDENHVRRLVKTLEENPRTLAAQPILVNERFEVIDGQHRLEACKQLGFPVYFIVVPHISIDDTRILNVNQKSWSVLDFVRSYAESGDVNYQRYNELVETYGYAHSVMLEACGLRHTGGGHHYHYAMSPLKLLKSGELSLPKTKFEYAKKKLDKLDELQEIVPIVAKKIYSIALLRIMESDEYKHSRMKNKMSMYGGDLVVVDSLREAGRSLEEVYNRRQRMNLARFSVADRQ